MDRRYEIAVIAIIFGVGIGLFTTALFLDSTPFYVSSGCVASIGVVVTIYFCLKHKKQQVTAAQPTFQYRDPGMKRNKSDTDLTLIGETPVGGLV